MNHETADRQEVTIEVRGAKSRLVIERTKNGSSAVRIAGRMVTRPLSADETERRIMIEGTEWLLVRHDDGSFSINRQMSPVARVVNVMAVRAVDAFSRLSDAAAEVDWHADVRVPDQWRKRIPEWIDRATIAAFALIALPLFLCVFGYGAAAIVKIESDSAFQMVLEIEGRSASPPVEAGRRMIRVVGMTLFVVGTVAILMPAGLAMKFAGHEEGLRLIELAAGFSAFVTVGGAAVAGGRLLQLLAIVRMPIEPVPGIFLLVGGATVGLILLLLCAIVISARILRRASASVATI